MTRTELENQTSAVTRLRVAWGLAAAGALLLTVGPLLGVVDGAAPAYTSWPLLAVLALLPPALAGALWLRGRPFVAAAVLAAVGAFAPGRLLGDLQIIGHTMTVGRPELFRPSGLVAPPTGTGLWLLVLGHVLVLAGGVLAAGRAGVPSDEEDTPRQLAVFLPVAALAAIALLGEPFSSTDVYLLPRSPWDLPVLGLIGGLLLAAAAPLVAALTGSSPDPDTRRGGMLGVALGLAAVAAPSLAAGLFADALGVTWAPVVALLAAAVLVALSFRSARTDEKDQAAEEIVLPALHRLHAATGVFAVLAAAAAVVGAIAPQVVVDGEEPVFYAARLLWPTGLALAVLGLLMFVRTAAGTARPALVYAVYATLVASVFSVQTVSLASQSGLAEPAPGFWVMSAVYPLGLVALVCAAVAGGAERENADQRKPGHVPLAELGATLLAGLFAIGAFALPTMKATGYTPPDLVGNYDPIVSTTLVAALLLLLAALFLALRSRPQRGAPLLAGAALLVGVRALELPLTGARVEGTTAAPGTWLALASVVALLVAAGSMAARASR
ncbi:hypothetical protein [Nocardia sp. NRRL S-836]|uniref:hypothetical protein n=1 Tax=Nocardia sp. NRRL S-836 TaxID=1519492 RepID=UPI0006AF6809|nr:hypothetical protein [Nocardia sp. NRRL S-836]KOV80654.1 hypothetical protein ADL03_32415 [Nocardia sp. NRRL S-836]